MTFNAWAIAKEVLEIDIRNTDGVVKLVSIIERVRDGGIRDAATLCADKADAQHAKYWQATNDGDQAAAHRHATRRDFAALLKEDIRRLCTGGDHAHPRQEAQVRHPEASQEQPVGSTEEKAGRRAGDGEGAAGTGDTVH